MNVSPWISQVWRTVYPRTLMGNCDLNLGIKDRGLFITQRQCYQGMPESPVFFTGVS